MPRNRRNRKLEKPGDKSEPEEEEEEEEQGDSDTQQLLRPEEAKGKDSTTAETMGPSRGLRGDETNIAVLLFLYVLQGIPLGLAAAIPLILTNRHVSYKQQAEFSFAYWPFSVKLLWAPVVDSCFVSSFGRRKTWLVPVQYLLGLTMMLLAGNVDHYLGDDDEHGGGPDVFMLTCMFFFLNFLAATQDIAVDGWALTMLQRHNVGHASTCNSVGQTAGYFLGYVFYMGLESYGLVTLSGYLFFWGVVFLAATTLVALFKHETDTRTPAERDDEPDLGVAETYKLLYKIVRLPIMPVMIFVLLTSKIGFSATDAVTSLKLIERGVPKDKLAMLAIPMMPLQIVLPVIISRYTAGPRPMHVFLKAMPARLLFGLVFAGVVYVTPGFMLPDGQFPASYYAMVLLVYALHQVSANCMFVAIMAFFAQVSDPAVGGTYMTLLNTLTNLGGNWPATVALWFVDAITEKECVLGAAANATAADALEGNRCDGAEQTRLCEVGGGTCVTMTEGYYIESAACTLIGFVWLCWGWYAIKRLQAADQSAWRVVKAKKGSKRSV